MSSMLTIGKHSKHQFFQRTHFFEAMLPKCRTLFLACGKSVTKIKIRTVHGIIDLYDNVGEN